VLRIHRFINAEKFLDWASEHKVAVFLGTETVNLAKSHFGMDAMGYCSH
jgi:hypothetical protein